MIIKFWKPRAAGIFLGLLIAAIMRMLWFGLMGKKVTDPLGLTAISIAMIALFCLSFFHSRDKE
jgi:hypothetical protein